GEPLEQENVYPLMSWFCDNAYTVAVETGGHINTEFVDKRVIRIIDMKCPDSKMVTLNNYDNLRNLRPHDEIKFVIASRTDYDWAKGIVTEYELPHHAGAVLFSSVFSILPLQTLAEWILEDRLDVRMQVQMHKFIWHPDTRGV
ncbi:MAG: 7-carboxy-7-deazaguanine synthase, partial [Candidatus Kapabacteria bacterium]|nr:7-carboxy-7-deazaguanine synthase [Candidatus Kapabacteria bacterium]